VTSTTLRHSTIVLIVAAAAAAATAAQGPPPARPATARLSAYVAAFNSGEMTQMRKFIEEHFGETALRETSLDTRLARYQSASTRFRTMTIQRVVAEQADRSIALVATGNQQAFLLAAIVEPAPPHRLVAITLEMVDDPNDMVIPAPAKDVPALLEAVRGELDTRTKADEFSGVVLVARGEQVLFHEAYGPADRVKGVPNRRDTRFNLGSINKSFTQVAIHQLEKAGRLSLGDLIGKFLPDYPNKQAAEQVTIRQLLEMTSGIGDFFGPRYDATPKEAIRGIADYLPLFADRPLEFAPGTGYRYSNGGYVVLGAIIERVSGTDYYTYVREHVFKPCGMHATDSYARDARTPNLALGYTTRGAGGRERVQNLATLPGRGSSAGGGYSTAEDLLRYVSALDTGKLVLPDLRGGLAMAGGAPGINAAIEWNRATGHVVIALANLDPPAATQVARRITAWLPR
jgi:CubicO group peptidase (beta-lactamase class C family)